MFLFKAFLTQDVDDTGKPGKSLKSLLSCEPPPSPRYHTKGTTDQVLL